MENRIITCQHGSRFFVRCAQRVEKKESHVSGAKLDYSLHRIKPASETWISPARGPRNFGLMVASNAFAAMSYFCLRRRRRISMTLFRASTLVAVVAIGYPIRAFFVQPLLILFSW